MKTKAQCAADGDECVCYDSCQTGLTLYPQYDTFDQVDLTYLDTLNTTTSSYVSDDTK